MSSRSTLSAQNNLALEHGHLRPDRRDLLSMRHAQLRMLTQQRSTTCRRTSRDSANGSRALCWSTTITSSRPGVPTRRCSRSSITIATAACTSAPRQESSAWRPSRARRSWPWRSSCTITFTRYADRPSARLTCRARPSAARCTCAAALGHRDRHQGSQERPSDRQACDRVPGAAVVLEGPQDEAADESDRCECRMPAQRLITQARR